MAGAEQVGATGSDIPQGEWDEFLTRFSGDHEGWRVRLETHDRVTGEDVVSPDSRLQSIDYDLEDEKNPRINVVVRLDNKVIKHILFRPSLVALRPSVDALEKCLQVRSVNTETSVHLWPGRGSESAE
jgi:hypothetical protein